ITMTEVTSLGVALLLCLLGQVESRPSCGVDARPHSEGICGNTLMRARQNLCFLLYADYPDLFEHRGRRSVDDIFDLPIEAFTKMHVQGDDMGEDVTDLPVTPKDKFPFLPLLLSKAQSAGRALQSKRARGAESKGAGADEITEVQKRGLVCDCCYNKCLPSVLARYC
ncbi:hypothetical protein BaRGS_00033971, partial [Batillaria attramentaria]